MGAKKIILLIGLVFFVTGCHINYDFHSRALPLRCTDLSDVNENALNSKQFCALEGEKTCINWWALFEDPQLSELIAASIECHPDIELASARLRLAGEKALLARSTLYPHFNFDAQIYRQKISDFASIPGQVDLFTEVGLDITGYWDLDIWNRNRSLYYAELDDVLAAFADRQTAEVLLASSIARAYFDLQGNYARLEIAKERLTARKKLTELMSLRFSSGISDEFEFLQTDTEQALIEDLIYFLEGQIYIDQAMIAALVGNATRCCIPKAQMHEAPNGSLPKQLPLPACLPIDLLARRPEITAQKWRIQAKCFRIGAAQAAFYPNVNLLGYIGLRSFKLAKLLQGGSIEYLGEAASNLPLYNAGELQSKLGIAREEYEIAVEEYNKMILNAVEEVSSALGELIALGERQENVQRAINDAKTGWNLSSLRYENGIDPLTTVLNAEENYFLQKDLEAIIFAARLIATVNLIQSIGGGYYE